MTSQKFLVDYNAACSSGDQDRVAEFLHDDVAIYDTMVPPVEGKEAVLASNKAIFGMWESPSWHVDNYLGDSDRAAVEWTMVGRKDGVQHVLRGMDWYVFEDGKIREVHQYWAFNRKGTESALKGYPYADDTTYHPPTP